MKDTHKWSRSKKLMIAFDCILCLTIIVSSMLIVIDKSRIKSGVIYDGKVTTVTTAPADKPAAKSESKGTDARLMFAGDNLIHRGIFSEAEDRADGDGYDFLYAYEGIKDVISLADLAFVNQETVIDPENEVDSYPLFNSPSQVLDSLIDIGFDVFNQSNNHVLDMGVSGAQNDIKVFSEKKAVLTGLYATEEELMKAHTKEVNGIKISFVNVTYSLGETELSEDDNIGILCLTDERYSEDEIDGKLKVMMTNAEKASDLVCVSVHFGDNDSTEPSETQQEIVDKLLGYGADIIVGTGPQVLQPVEMKKNSNNEQALVIWSLGNLISCHDSEDYLLGGIADVTVKKDTATGNVTVSSAKMIPIVTHYGEGISDIRVMTFKNYSPELANGHGVEIEDFYDYMDSFFTELFGNKLEKEYK